MSGKISIILLEDIKSLGKAGDVVEVAEGYARNALFPTGRAALASDHVRERQKREHERQEAQDQQKLSDLQQKAQSLDGSELTIKARVHEGDELYGSVTAKDISSKINEDADLKTQEQDILPDSAIKKVGTYDVTVRLSEDVDFMLKVTVVPDEGSMEQQDVDKE